LTKCDFRLIAATHENLEKLVEEGKFRKDLFYRLNVIPIQIPPLRERKEDIPPIAEHLIELLNKDLGTHVTRISPEVLDVFGNYNWPGNVRELANILERIIYSTEGDTIQTHHLPFFLQSLREGSNRLRPTFLRRLRDDMEREALLHAIHISNDNKNRAARLLGIHRTALYKKMKKFNIPLTTA
jgi:transcriptional regulator with PAS, ATPase and Fis domain